MSQVDDGAPLTQGKGGCTRCAGSRLLRVLAKKLEGRGLASRLVDYPEEMHDGGEHVEEVVVVNPAARERGEVRVGDDGSVTWEYFGKLDEAGVEKILDEATNALRATGLRLRSGQP